MTLSFNGVINQLADASIPTSGGFFTNAGLGTFNLSGMSGTISSPVAVGLQISQVTPSLGTSSGLFATATGTFTFPPGGAGQIAWSSIHAEIGLVEYDILTGSVILIPSLSNTGGGPGNTMVHAQATVTPEPSTLLLVGTGLPVLAGVARRRLARRP